MSTLGGTVKVGGMRANLARTLGWIYGLQVFLVLPWFLGAIYREEQSPWVWREYARSAALHGQGDGLLVAYLYAVFYSSLMVLPYWLLSLRYRGEGNSPASAETDFDLRFRTALIRLWLGATVVLFLQPLAALMRGVDTRAFLAWLLMGILVVVTWREMEKGRRG